jgi:hypothetical protein
MARYSKFIAGIITSEELRKFYDSPRKLNVYIPCLYFKNNSIFISETQMNHIETLDVVTMMLNYKNKYWGIVSSRLYFLFYPCKKCVLRGCCTLICDNQERYHRKFTNLRRIIRKTCTTAYYFIVACYFTLILIALFLE